MDLSGEIYGIVDNNVEDQVEKTDGLMRKVLEKMKQMSQKSGIASRMRL